MDGRVRVGRRRCEVPHGLLERAHDLDGAAAPRGARGEPVAPRVRERRRHGPLPRQAAPDGRHRAQDGRADPHPRRRRVPGPGHRGRVLQHDAPRRLHRRRHDPCGRQQPGRLHHESARHLLRQLLHRQREGLRVPRAACERRRRRGVRVGREARDRLAPGVRPRHRGRDVVLPEERSQRDRRADVHAAAPLQPREEGAHRVQDLPREARRRRHGRRGRGRRDARRTERRDGRGAERGEEAADRSGDRSVQERMGRPHGPLLARARRDGRAAGDAREAREEARGRARPRVAPQDGVAPARAARGRGRRGADRLGARRDARVRDAPHRRSPCAALRTGCRAWHLQSSPLRGELPEHGRGLLLAQRS